MIFLTARKKSLISEWHPMVLAISLDSFLDFSLLIFSQITFWEILDIKHTKGDSKNSFSRGVTYDPIKDIILPINS